VGVAGPANQLHAPKGQRPSTAGVRRSVEGTVDIAAARKAAGAASRAAVRASRPASALPAPAAVGGEGGEGGGIAGNNSDAVNDATGDVIPVELSTAPVVTPTTASTSMALPAGTPSEIVVVDPLIQASPPSPPTSSPPLTVESSSTVPAMDPKP
jgi:hypothetical protein